MPVTPEPSERSELEQALQERGVGVQTTDETLRKIAQEILKEILSIIGFYFSWSSQEPKNNKFDQYVIDLEESIERILKLRVGTNLRKGKYG